jgi:predicted ribosome quality control (RQC) complex YloA/Tae2 family protein
VGKGHLTAVDVAASAKELSIALAGCRLTNVYDLNARTYLFKFGRPGGYKAFLIVESGIRYHLTSFERETNPLPNSFAMKLRKHLRTR